MEGTKERNEGKKRRKRRGKRRKRRDETRGPWAQMQSKAKAKRHFHSLHIDWAPCSHVLAPYFAKIHTHFLAPHTHSRRGLLCLCVCGHKMLCALVINAWSQVSLTSRSFVCVTLGRSRPSLAMIYYNNRVFMYDTRKKTKITKI